MYLAAEGSCSLFESALASLSINKQLKGVTSPNSAMLLRLNEQSPSLVGELVAVEVNVAGGFGRITLPTVVRDSLGDCEPQTEIPACTFRGKYHSGGCHTPEDGDGEEGGAWY